jgi:hypothetical protein
VWHALHQELAQLSGRGVHRLVPGADHQALLANPEHARATVDAIREVVDAARREGEHEARPTPTH